MIAGDSITRACVAIGCIAGVAAVLAQPAQSAEFRLIYCYDPATATDTVYSIAQAGDAVFVSPGSSDVTILGESYIWSKGPETTILSADQLVTILPDAVSRASCHDITDEVISQVRGIMQDDPTITEALKEAHAAGVTATIADSEVLRLRTELEALTEEIAQVYRAHPNVRADAPAADFTIDQCKEMVEQWRSGDSSALVAKYGSRTASIVPACKAKLAAAN